MTRSCLLSSETNDGKTVGEEGKTLDDATITGGINWYFKNVEVK